MHSKAQRIRLVALLLGILFLGAQFHFCVDSSATPSVSHLCPVCSVISSAVASASPSLAVIPVANRLEIVAVVFTIFSTVPRDLSPRAPPAL